MEERTLLAGAGLAGELPNDSQTTSPQSIVDNSPQAEVVESTQARLPVRHDSASQGPADPTSPNVAPSGNDKLETVDVPSSAAESRVLVSPLISSSSPDEDSSSNEKNSAIEFGQSASLQTSTVSFNSSSASSSTGGSAVSSSPSANFPQSSSRDVNTTSDFAANDRKDNGTVLASLKAGATSNPTNSSLGDPEPLPSSFAQDSQKAVDQTVKPSNLFAPQSDIEELRVDLGQIDPAAVNSPNAIPTAVSLESKRAETSSTIQLMSGKEAIDNEAFEIKPLGEARMTTDQKPQIERDLPAISTSKALESTAPIKANEGSATELSSPASDVPKSVPAENGVRNEPKLNPTPGIVSENIAPAVNAEMQSPPAAMKGNGNAYGNGNGNAYGLSKGNGPKNKDVTVAERIDVVNISASSENVTTSHSTVIASRAEPESIEKGSAIATSFTKTVPTTEKPSNNVVAVAASKPQSNSNSRVESGPLAQVPELEIPAVVELVSSSRAKAPDPVKMATNVDPVASSSQTQMKLTSKNDLYVSAPSARPSNASALVAESNNASLLKAGANPVSVSNSANQPILSPFLPVGRLRPAFVATSPFTERLAVQFSQTKLVIPNSSEFSLQIVSKPIVPAPVNWLGMMLMSGEQFPEASDDSHENDSDRVQRGPVKAKTDANETSKENEQTEPDNAKPQQGEAEAELGQLVEIHADSIEFKRVERPLILPAADGEATELDSTQTATVQSGEQHARSSIGTLVLGLIAFALPPKRGRSRSPRANRDD